MSGTGYRHIVYRKPGKGPRLHIYLEGDGAPLFRKTVPMADPALARGLALALAARDPGPAVLIGRPCYHGLAKRTPCRPTDWTDGRYARRIVASLAAVATIESARAGNADIVLIGHSGGARLALALADLVPGIVGIVSVAGVLDAEAWRRHSGLPPFRDLAPAAPARRGRFERHLIGGRDPVAPPRLFRNALAQRTGASVHHEPGFDHTCCWIEAWPQLLRRLPAP